MGIRLLEIDEIAGLCDIVHEVENIDDSCDDFLDVSPHFFSVMKDKEVVCYGAFDHETLIAYYLVSFEGIQQNVLPKNALIQSVESSKIAVISSFLVSPTFRGKGLQKTFTKLAESEAVKRGFSDMFVMINYDNVIVKNNFEDIGYSSLNKGRRKYEVYWKSLNNE